MKKMFKIIFMILLLLLTIDFKLNANETADQISNRVDYSENIIVIDFYYGLQS